MQYRSSQVKPFEFQSGSGFQRRRAADRPGGKHAIESRLTSARGHEMLEVKVTADLNEEVVRAETCVDSLVD